MTQNEMKIVEEQTEEIPQGQPPEGIKRESLEEIQAQGRETVQLTESESMEFSRFCSTASVVGYAGNDIGQSIQICQEDIRSLEHRINFEKQRLEILEKNKAKIDKALESYMGKVRGCFDKVALRLDRKVEDFDTFGVFLDEDENVTHLVDAPKGETDEKK